MNRQNAESLRGHFPELFRLRPKGPEGSLLPFDFACGDGWYDLIFRLCRELMDHCARTGEAVPEVRQVKEKFGELRFYTPPVSQDMFEIIGKYCALSRRTCELTGRPGRLCRSQGRLKTLCDEEALRLGFDPVGEDEE